MSDLEALNYRVYPRRTDEEAAVLEWGHSAIISALDASVAHFGPQTNQAALLEVEAQPILANPVNGVFPDAKDSGGEGAEQDSKTIRPLINADEVHGNLVVMTNTGHLTGIDMAKIAQESGAAALVVVNVDEERPDDISRLPSGEGADDIDIPVVMISLNSANVLTTATVENDMRPEDIVNNGMPDRVRLYSGGDRPFFEDVDTSGPVIYLIHNLLNAEECDSLVNQAKSRVTSVTENDELQLTHDSQNYVNVERVFLWQGMLQSQERKQIEERIEQVTGFPSDHLSDFVVDRLSEGSHWKPHYDTFPSVGKEMPMASMTIFLSEEQDGGEIVYPSTQDGKPVKINPARGLAVVHHNYEEKGTFDMSSLHAMLSTSKGPVYVARKFIFSAPVSNARRIALPVYAAPFGGKLPSPIVSLYELLVDRFGYEDGGFYFDKLVVFFPILIILMATQAIVNYARSQMSGNSNNDKKKKRE